MSQADPPPDPSFSDLDARLRAARDRAEPKAGQGKLMGLPPQGLGLAMRVGVELVAALAVGSGLGYVLDLWLGTWPWGFILLFFLGAGAGVMNVHRAVTGAGMAAGYRRPDDETRPPGGTTN
ncbi:MAG TPA: AtpZ/AtpI family protein [Alphaproteobacteria bacterium]|nr:AtpZ/AtpI family protein [Alphaproteobacteria bacterium]